MTMQFTKDALTGANLLIEEKVDRRRKPAGKKHMRKELYPIAHYMKLRAPETTLEALADMLRSVAPEIMVPNINTDLLAEWELNKAVRPLKVRPMASVRRKAAKAIVGQNPGEWTLKKAMGHFSLRFEDVQAIEKELGVRLERSIGT